MPDFGRILPVLAFVAISAGCGSSPTSPDLAGAPTLSAPASSSTSAPLKLSEFAPPTNCGVTGLSLSLVPSTDKVSREVEATFKGDPTYCGSLEWSVSPKTRLDVSKDGRRATVFDPGGKFGEVNVTASFPPNKLTATLRVTFPRLGK